MSKLIISRMEIRGRLCDYSALIEEKRLVEFHFQPTDERRLLNNIYVGQVESISQNIQAAFIKVDKDTPCYCPLKEQKNAIYTNPKKKQEMVPGDQILVQVCREAMKGKPPAVTTNLNFAGKYMVLTTGNRLIGFSSKLNKEQRTQLKSWIHEDLPYGMIIRTNAAGTTEAEFRRELEQLHQRWQRVMDYGISRTCFSLVEESEPFYLTAVRNAYTRNLEEIITDYPELQERVTAYLKAFQPEDLGLLRFYEDEMLSLTKLYSIEKKFQELCNEKVWLKSGGFLIIQQTDAFLSIDVNTGKYTGKKKASETYRKINLEAAEEIAHQLRARRLSGIILIDFINMENPDHIEELLHVLQNHLRRDPVQSMVHDMTKLNIVEVTRKKLEKPLTEQLREL